MSTVQGLPLPSPAPGLASLAPGPRATAREPGPEVGAIRAVAAVGDQQGRVAFQRGDRSDPRSEPRTDVGSGGERQERPAETSRRDAAWTGHRPTAFAGAFVAQLLSQGGSWGGSGGISTALLSSGRQAELGSDAYRRAGGEPPVYSEAPSLFRIAV